MTKDYTYKILNGSEFLKTCRFLELACTEHIRYIVSSKWSFFPYKNNCFEPEAKESSIKNRKYHIRKE